MVNGVVSLSPEPENERGVLGVESELSFALGSEAGPGSGFKCAWAQAKRMHIKLAIKNTALFRTPFE
jgi:hypothetical protein